MTAAAAEKKPFHGPWIIAACFLTFGLSTGFPYYNIAFFFDYFRDDHSWTAEFVTMGAPLAANLVKKLCVARQAIRTSISKQHPNNGDLNVY